MSDLVYLYLKNDSWKKKKKKKKGEKTTLKSTVVFWHISLKFSHHLAWGSVFWDVCLDGVSSEEDATELYETSVSHCVDIGLVLNKSKARNTQEYIFNKQTPKIPPLV